MLESETYWLRLRLNVVPTVALWLGIEAICGGGAVVSTTEKPAIVV